MKNNEYHRNHRRNNPEMYKKHRKKYYENNKERILAKIKETRKNNKEKISKHYQENKDRFSSSRKKYHKNNRDKINERHKATQQKYRNAFLSMYGNKCNCCGETLNEFLTIEHKLGQKGKKKESSHSAWRKATSEYRPDLYEILCMNCNHSKGRYGYCPHRPISGS